MIWDPGRRVENDFSVEVWRKSIPEKRSQHVGGENSKRVEKQVKGSEAK